MQRPRRSSRCRKARSSRGCSGPARIWPRRCAKLDSRPPAAGTTSGHAPSHSPRPWMRHPTFLHAHGNTTGGRTTPMTPDKNAPNERDPLGTNGLRPAEDVGHLDEWPSLALDLIEGTLPPEAAAPLEAHLAACPDCRRALAEQRSIVSILRAVPHVAVPADLEHAVLAGLTGTSGSEPAAAARDASGRTWVQGGALQSLRRLLTVRVWLPAAAVALVAGIALSSHARMGRDADEGMSPMATESAQKDTSLAQPESSGADSSTFGSALGGEGTQTTVAGAATTTTAAGAGAETTATTASTAPLVVLTLGLPGDDPDTLALRVEGLTGLEPLPQDSWIGGRTTYAALI